MCANCFTKSNICAITILNIIVIVKNFTGLYNDITNFLKFSFSILIFLFFYYYNSHQIILTFCLYIDYNKYRKWQIHKRGFAEISCKKLTPNSPKLQMWAFFIYVVAYQPSSCIELLLRQRLMLKKILKRILKIELL